MTSNAVQELFARLRPLGLSKTYVRRFFPDWWTDEAAASPAAVQELKLQLARQFGIEPLALLRGDSVPQFALPSRPRFKRSRRSSASDPTCSTSIAVAIARMVIAATQRSYVPISTDPRAVRDEILATGAKWISLRALGRYCWEHGIPIVHISDFPEGQTKVDGIAIDIDGRPVIILSRDSRKLAWQLFILGHEVGHLGARHLGTDAIIVDEDIEETSDADPDEAVADRYALTLLGGDPDLRVSVEGSPSAAGLARAALERGRQLQIDPGHLVLKYAYNNNAWALANAALELMDPNSIAPQEINRWLFNEIDLGILPEESREFLAKMMQHKTER